MPSLLRGETIDFDFNIQPFAEILGGMIQRGLVKLNTNRRDQRFFDRQIWFARELPRFERVQVLLGSHIDGLRYVA